ncbi:hypothetical protein TL16_g01514 [Triparma laevis f. inornata]|uniref:Uncharacterized protein n=1 Tax=Triparma laevis f. inornata TaxID=1714386 RepID=A0A9W6ZPM1_9STRA|nr:hypothetical protein TL16_g01514 [Triparma laevis f. inornata]
MEDETERADEAEDHLYALRAQNDQFKDRIAQREATIETEANEYFDLAAQSMYEESDLSKKVQSVVLMNLMNGGYLDVVKDSAKVLQGLGLLTAEGMAEHVENVTMMKEEMAQREAEIKATVKRAKTPNGKEKGGKEGGGGGVGRARRLGVSALRVVRRVRLKETGVWVCAACK